MKHSKKQLQVWIEHRREKGITTQMALDQIDELEAAIEALFQHTRGRRRVNPNSRAFQRLWDLRPAFYNPVTQEGRA